MGGWIAAADGRGSGRNSFVGLCCGEMMRKFRRVVGLGMLGLVVGCKPDAAVRSGALIDKTGVKRAVQPTSSLDPATLGSVGGVVRFAGKAPERIRIDMSQDPVCSLSGGENLTEQYLVTGGKLANVYVYVKSGPAAVMNLAPSGTPVVMDQVGCQYRPHVVAVQAGGSVEFRNSDSTMHNIHTMPAVVGNEVIDVSQGPKGAPQVRAFPQVETMLPVRCNNHPWMNAFINVAPTPFFAVTGADGSFTMTGLPAGTYTIAAVHEKMGEQIMQVTVAAGKTGKAEFSFSQK